MLFISSIIIAGSIVVGIWDISFVWAEKKAGVIAVDAISTQLAIFQGFLVLTGILMAFLGFMGYGKLQTLIEEQAKAAAENALKKQLNEFKKIYGLEEQESKTETITDVQEKPKDKTSEEN